MKVNVREGGVLSVLKWSAEFLKDH